MTQNVPLKGVCGQRHGASAGQHLAAAHRRQGRQGLTDSAGYPSFSYNKIPKQGRRSDDCIVCLTDFGRSDWIEPGCVKALRAAERRAPPSAALSARRLQKQSQR